MKDKMMTRHHRLPKSIGGSDHAFNISMVPADLHVAWHTLFVNYDAQTIANIINNVWLDPKVKFVLKKR